MTRFQISLIGGIALGAAGAMGAAAQTTPATSVAYATLDAELSFAVALLAEPCGYDVDLDAVMDVVVRASAAGADMTFALHRAREDAVEAAAAGPDSALCVEAAAAASLSGMMAD